MRGESLLTAVVACWICVIPSTVTAKVLINGDFDTVGTNGNPVTVNAIDTQNSAALGWVQWAIAPDSFVTTELIPSTDPLGGGLMMHVTTNAGETLAAGFGNGFGQPINAPHGGTLSFDIFVVSGQVFGGLVEVAAGGSFAPGTGVFSSHVWEHFTQTFDQPVRDVRFETLTIGAGAEYYVDSADFDPGRRVAEPASLALFCSTLLTTTLAARDRPTKLRRSDC